MMKKIVLSALCLCLPILGFSTPSQDLKVGIVSFKKCMEGSKLGRNEQNSFEAMRKQMTDILEKTEQDLASLLARLDDATYMDSIEPAAEEELNLKLQTVNQERAKYQNQYYQVLNSASVKMMNTMMATINRAAKQVASLKNLQLVLNDDTSFFYNASLDITEDVILEMDGLYEKEMDKTSDAKSLENLPEENS